MQKEQDTYILTPVRDLWLEEERQADNHGP